MVNLFVCACVRACVYVPVWWGQSRPEAGRRPKVVQREHHLLHWRKQPRADHPIQPRGEQQLPHQHQQQHAHTCTLVRGIVLSACLSSQNAEKIFNSGYTVHGLVFFNSSLESHVAMVEESRSLAKQFKTKVVCPCLRVSVSVSLSASLNRCYFGRRSCLSQLTCPSHFPTCSTTLACLRTTSPQLASSTWRPERNTRFPRRNTR